MIVGLGGRPLPLHWQVCLEIERQDDNVVLPLLTITALVVDNLNVVGAEILVGADAIAQSGGVRLQYDKETATQWSFFFFGDAVAAVAADVADGQDTRPPRHVNVVREGDGVALLTQDGDVRWVAEAKRLAMRQTDDGHVYRTSENSLPETQADETLPEPQLAKRSGTPITEVSKHKSKLSKDSHPISETTESSVPFEKPVKVREVNVQQEKAATKQCVDFDSSESCGSSFASKDNDLHKRQRHEAAENVIDDEATKKTRKKKKN